MRRRWREKSAFHLRVRRLESTGGYGVSARTTKALRIDRFDAIHLNDEGLNRLANSAILLKTRDENRVVLTFDLDFGELLAVSGGRSVG